MQKLEVKKIAQVVLILGSILLSFFLLTTKTKAQEAQKAGTSSYGTTGNYQSFANGYIYQSKHGTYSVWGEIKEIHNKNGGTWGVYGFPTSDRYKEGPTGRECQNFENNQKICIGGVEIEPKCKANEVEINEKCYSRVDRDDDDLSDQLEDELMKMYAPLLKFDKEEKYFPSSIKWTLEGSELMARQSLSSLCGVTSYGHIDLENDLIGRKVYEFGAKLEGVPEDYPGSYCGNKSNVIFTSSSNNNIDKDNYFYLNLDDSSRSGESNFDNNEIYTRIYKDDSDNITIQYWYYIPFNEPAALSLAGWKHEGDWENISITLNYMNSPLNAYYINHGNAIKYEWSDIEKIDKHPVVYIGEGTHASYPFEKLIDATTNLQEASFELGKEWSTWEKGVLVNVGESSDRGGRALRDFIKYSGRWGETRPIYNDPVLQSNAFSPFTMSYQDNWFFYERK